VLLLVHGYAEHSGRYEEMACWFAARGCAVHAYDHRGHGRSQGPRCHVDRFEQFLDDLGLVLDTVRSEHPELPISLIGHSMGGLITLAFLTSRKPRLSSAVTSGAALSVGAVSPFRIALARAARRVLPRLALGSGQLDGAATAHRVAEDQGDEEHAQAGHGVVAEEPAIGEQETCSPIAFSALRSTA
jgi:alpha-beta hydrolase superfamily lysophospholipase